MAMITLTTDFGTRDAYVGVMKGVILQLCPDVSIVDLAHEVPAHDVRGAAYLLLTALPYFHRDCIHVAVVDPGVGTSRRAIAAWTPWGTLVGPDNGIFSYVLAFAPATFMVSLDDAEGHLPSVSATFHGRDIFAPVAGHIARGVPLRELGSTIKDPVRLPFPYLEATATHLSGEVLYIDAFGNVTTSIGRLSLVDGQVRFSQTFGEGPSYMYDPARLTVRVGGREIKTLRHTYGDSVPGEPMALIGSSGMLEIALNQGHAARQLGLSSGDRVEVVVA